MNDTEKLVQLVSWGMNPKDIKETWAWSNFEQAKALQAMFDAFINQARSL